MLATVRTLARRQQADEAESLDAVCGYLSEFHKADAGLPEEVIVDTIGRGRRREERLAILEALVGGAQQSISQRSSR